MWYDFGERSDQVGVVQLKHGKADGGGREQFRLFCYYYEALKVRRSVHSLVCLPSSVCFWVSGCRLFVLWCEAHFMS